MNNDDVLPDRHSRMDGKWRGFVRRLFARAGRRGSADRRSRAAAGARASAIRPVVDEHAKRGDAASTVPDANSPAWQTRLLDTAVVPRSERGQPYWRYRRPDIATVTRKTEREPAPVPEAASTGVAESESVQPRGIETAVAQRSGAVPAMLAVLLLAVALANGRWFEVPTVGRVSIAGAAVLAALAFAPSLARRHPDEPWLARLLVLGVVFKLGASLARYFTLVDGYGGVGDATQYHEFGVEYVQGTAPVLEEIRKTAFIQWFTGNLYKVLGADMVTGFFVYGLIAFVGAYLWYRAAAVAIPSLNRRWYCMIMFFVPSIAFWPSSIGKEAIMQLGIGSAALGTAHLLQYRVLRGIAFAAPGGYLMWAVRPHLLAMVVLAAGAAYLVGRGQRTDTRASTSLMRPIGLVIVAMLCVFATTQAMDFLGMEEFSLDAIEAELNEQTGRTAQGGSEIKNTGEVSLTPLSVPQGAVTVLLRPFVWEVDSGFQILASIEAAAITFFVVRRYRSLTFSLRQSRRVPFLFYCWTLLALYSVAFSAFANMGLLVRQRSLVLPALFALLCTEPPLKPDDHQGLPPSTGHDERVAV